MRNNQNGQQWGIFIQIMVYQFNKIIFYNDDSKNSVLDGNI